MAPGPQYPINGEAFELTISEPFAGLKMVYDDYCGLWHFTGFEITWPQTKHFKLVSIGSCPNLDCVRGKLKEHGVIPRGQWIRAFQKVYLRPDGKGPIGVADPAWHNSSDACFPAIGSKGKEGFCCAHGGYAADWRWLVEIGDSSHLARVDFGDFGICGGEW